MIRLGDAPARRRPSLTPMIDVVFLLLVFFMLASRFGTTGSLPVGGAGGIGPVSGPPRLVEVSPGVVRLNGVPVTLDALPGAVLSLVQSPATDLVVVRPRDDADLQRLVDVLGALEAAGFARVAVAGPPE